MLAAEIEARLASPRLMQTVAGGMDQRVARAPVSVQSLWEQRMKQPLAEDVRLLQSDVADATGLTPREDDILRLIAKGCSNTLIARELDPSVGTVKVHVEHVLKKLRLKSRVEAAVWVVSSQRWPCREPRSGVAAHLPDQDALDLHLIR